MAFSWITAILIAFTTGCASMCGQGSSMRNFCDDSSKGNADLAAEVEAQNHVREQKEQQRQAEIKRIQDEQQSAIDNPSKQRGSKCVDIKTMQFQIVQKIDDHHYELVAEIDGPNPIHLLLETKKAIFISTGHPTGIGVENGFEGRSVHFKDGFDGHVGVLRECAIVPYETSARFPGMAYRKEIDGR